jgi:hypothetical protein
MTMRIKVFPTNRNWNSFQQLESKHKLDLDGRVGVEARGERLRASDLLVDVEVERLGLHAKKLTVDSLESRASSEKGFKVES